MMNNKDTKAQMFCGDCGEGDRIATLQYDLVLTDPPYDLQPEDKRILEIGAECAIRHIPLIMFSSPENQLIVPDEYQFWIKTPSTKNYSKRCGRFVEMILIDRNTSIRIISTKRSAFIKTVYYIRPFIHTKNQ